MATLWFIAPKHFYIIWSYPMKIIIETLRAHYILYLRFYLNNRCILWWTMYFPASLKCFHWCISYQAKRHRKQKRKCTSQYIRNNSNVCGTWHFALNGINIINYGLDTHIFLFEQNGLDVSDFSCVCLFIFNREHLNSVLFLYSYVASPR